MRGIMPGSTFCTSPRNSNLATSGNGGSWPKNADSAASSGRTWYRSASCQKSSLSSATLSGRSAARSLRLAEVVGQVVELGRVVVGVPDPGGEGLDRLRRHDPRDAGGLHREPPAVLVHGPVADRLEVLLRVVLRRVAVGERVAERRTHGAAAGRCRPPRPVPGCRRARGSSGRYRSRASTATAARPGRRPGRANGRPSGRGSRRDASATCLPHWNGVLPAHAQAAP